MRRHALSSTALAVLALTAAGLASAQSVSVTGRLNASVGKPIGSKQKQVMDIANSLLAFGGTEPLGGGLSATFGMEHRFLSDTGTDASGTNTFWNGYSFVGLRHDDYGIVQLGRFYTASFMSAQDRFDPFAGDTVAGVRGNSLSAFFFPAGAGGSGAIVRARTPNIVYYTLRPTAWLYGGTGFDVKASVGIERPGPGLKRAWSVGAGYQTKEMYIGFGHEDAEGKRDRMTTLGITYDLGVAKLAAAGSIGQDNSLTPGLADPTSQPKKYRGWLLGATVPAGVGQVRIAFGEASIGGNTFTRKLGVGYRHYLSKRTWIYTDIGHDWKARGPNPAFPNVNAERTGYDLGIAHYF